MGQILNEELIKEALICLYSPQQLAQTDLAQLLMPEANIQEKGQALRRILLDTIEVLKPKGRVVPSASEYRAYECITLRYVSGLSVEEIADELSLSPRQVYRDLHLGINRICSELSGRLYTTTSEQDKEICQEIQSMAYPKQPVSLIHQVQGAISALSSLAYSRSVHLQLYSPDEDISVMATTGILREAIVRLLSAAVQNLTNQEINVYIQKKAEGCKLSLSIGQVAEEVSLLCKSALSSLETQGAICTMNSIGDISVCFPISCNRRVVILEDNPSTTALYERYLEHTEWNILFAENQADFMQMAQKGADAIILDIMMPETDGWSILQELQLNEKTHIIPVLICSVVNDPELGRTLGARAYLTKPISRDALLACLSQVYDDTVDKDISGLH